MADKKIFIVDGDGMVATMLADQLSAFNTGEECLAQLHLHPNLVTLASYLNSVVKDAADGMRILEKIKKLDRQVHVIMLSSQTQYGIALQTVQKGAEQYVIKGKDQFDEIDRLVKEMLG